MPEDMSEYMPEDMSDRMPEDMSEYMPEDMPDRMPEDMSDRVPEDMPDRMPEDLPDRMPEDMPDHMPEDMPDRMSNRMSEDMSDRMPEDLPVRKCINVMVGITRSKVIISYYFLFKKLLLKCQFMTKIPIRSPLLNSGCLICYKLHLIFAIRFIGCNRGRVQWDILSKYEQIRKKIIIHYEEK